MTGQRLLVTARCRAGGHELATVHASSDGPVVEITRRAVDKSGVTKLSRNRGQELLDPAMIYAAPCKCEGIRKVPGSLLADAVRDRESVVFVD